MTVAKTLTINLLAGRYVVAVSGGVDSMVLLDVLRRLPNLNLVVAHVNHGIRQDAALDQALVGAYCRSHNIVFVAKELHLGTHASEATAREARALLSGGERDGAAA